MDLEFIEKYITKYRKDDDTGNTENDDSSACQPRPARTSGAFGALTDRGSD